MLNHVNDRYKQITITKQEIKFVTEQRLLRKNDEQKTLIREHLSRFTTFFNDLHANLEEYVELFPVHPAFFDNFQLVQVKNGQREILKTLSSKFENIKDNEVPDKFPGLISYDSYWTDLTAPNMQTDPDVHRINEIMSIISQKIDDNFVGVYANKNSLAHRIANACGIKILQSSLETTNGVTAETLVDDLCYLDSTCFDRDILRDVIDNTANKVVSATIGQYFEKTSLILNTICALSAESTTSKKSRTMPRCSQMLPKTPSTSISLWSSCLSKQNNIAESSKYGAIVSTGTPTRP